MECGEGILPAAFFGTLPFFFRSDCVEGLGWATSPTFGNVSGVSGAPNENFSARDTRSKQVMGDQHRTLQGAMAGFYPTLLRCSFIHLSRLRILGG